MWKHFGRKQNYHLICAIVFDFMVYPDPIFFIFKTKKWPHFFLRLQTDFFWSFVIMQGICNKLMKWKFCRMYGLAMIMSITTLNICQILIYYFFPRLRNYDYRKYLNPLCYWCAVVSVRIKFVCIHYETKLLFDCGCYENPLQLSSHNQIITLFWNSQLFLTSNKILLFILKKNIFKR